MHLKTRRLALSGMLCALAEVFLLLGSILPIAIYACPILAMTVLLPVREECGIKIAFSAYASVAILALILVPNKELAGVYLFLGWYPVVQPYLDRIPQRALQIAVKLAVFLAAVGIFYALVIFVFQIGAVVAEYGKDSLAVLVGLTAMGCVTFLLTDAALHRLALLWRTRLRRRWFQNE